MSAGKDFEAERRMFLKAINNAKIQTAVNCYEEMAAYAKYLEGIIHGIRKVVGDETDNSPAVIPSEVRAPAVEKELEAAKAWIISELKSGKAVVGKSIMWNWDADHLILLDEDVLDGMRLAAFWKLVSDDVIVRVGDNHFRLTESVTE